MLHTLQQLARDQHNDTEFGQLARPIVKSYLQNIGGPYPTARFLSPARPDVSGSPLTDEILKLYAVCPNDQDFGERLRQALA